MQNYEAGLRAMQEHKFEKARTHFRRSWLAPTANWPIGLPSTSTPATSIWRTTANQFKTPEEHYDYAVSLMNVGDYVTAREHSKSSGQASPKADYVAYGLAALDCLTGHVEDSLRHLGEADSR